MSFVVRAVISCGGPQPTEMCEYYAQLPSSSSPHLPSATSPAFLVVPANQIPPKKSPTTTRIVVISDTHELHRLISVPDGDILLHAGDVLAADRLSLGYFSTRRLKDFFKWFNELPHQHKIVIAGNHDHQFAKLGARAVKKMALPATYAEHEVLDIPLAVPDTSSKKSLRIFATPWSQANSKHSPNKSFQGVLPPPLPDTIHTNGGIDILLSHQGFACDGFDELMDAVRPKLCQIGGHVHEMHGVWRYGGLPCVNGSMMVGSYGREKLLRPIVVDVTL